jgi:hypothetical protein
VLWSSPTEQEAKPVDKDPVVEEEEEEAPPVPKKAPEPEPEIKEESSIASGILATASADASPDPAAPHESPAKDSRRLSDLSDSTESSSDETPPPTRRRMRTFVSSGRGSPTPRKAGSPADQEMMDMIAEAASAIDRIGKKLVDIGIRMKQQDQKIMQLEALPGSALARKTDVRKRGAN